MTALQFSHIQNVCIENLHNGNVKTMRRPLLLMMSLANFQNTKTITYFILYENNQNNNHNQRKYPLTLSDHFRTQSSYTCMLGFLDVRCSVPYVYSSYRDDMQAVYVANSTRQHLYVIDLNGFRARCPILFNDSHPRP